MVENMGVENAPKKKRHRSPNYPAVSLEKAVEYVKNLYKVDGRAGSPREAALKHMGFSKAHASALIVLSALKKFGLVEEKHGRVELTSRALNILVRPDTDPQRAEALREAVKAPTIYKELITQYAGGLPSDESLKVELIVNKGFNPSAVRRFIRDFRKSLEFAGLSNEDLVESSVGDEMPQMQDSVMNQVEPPPAAVGSRPPTTDLSPASARNQATKEVLNQRISPECVAQVIFQGPVTQRAIEKLIKHLELAKEDYLDNGDS